MEAYSVITVDLMPPKVKQYVESKMIRVQTVTQAKTLAANTEDWAYRTLDQQGTVGVLCFRGVEVALFYKRMVSKITMDEMDPVPEGPGIHPDRLWIRVEFFNARPAKDRNKVQVAYEENLEAEATRWKGLAQQTLLENEQLHKRLDFMADRLKAQKIKSVLPPAPKTLLSKTKFVKKYQKIQKKKKGSRK